MPEALRHPTFSCPTAPNASRLLIPARQGTSPGTNHTGHLGQLYMRASQGPGARLGLGRCSPDLRHLRHGGAMCGMEELCHIRSEDENQATHIQPDVAENHTVLQLLPQTPSPGLQTQKPTCGSRPQPPVPSPGHSPQAWLSPQGAEKSYHKVIWSPLQAGVFPQEGLVQRPGSHGSRVPRTHTASARPLGRALHPGVSSPVGKNSATQSSSPLTRIILGPLSKGSKRGKRERCHVHKNVGSSAQQICTECLTWTECRPSRGRRTGWDWRIPASATPREPRLPSQQRSTARGGLPITAGTRKAWPRRQKPSYGTETSPNPGPRSRGAHQDTARRPQTHLKFTPK
ncbi:uncharacterized protein LOC125103817 [Lutra lutra]|uniref:uncharacterized protein LOC125103817 n=1 Tax=Lutra lutra TaxID=9657 RepID=UPI001FD39C45|nr:uncharacterized protein LOC125103817 [Lutra lutra]